MIETIESLEDMQTVMAAERKAADRDYLPAESVRKLIAGEHPLRVWREHRALSQAQLATKADIQPGYLSEIENRKKPGSVAAYRAMASALAVSIEDILPND